MKTLRLLILAWLLLGGFLAQAQFTTPDYNPDMWVTNGNVKTIERSGNTIYQDSSFDFVGPNTGGGAPISISDGSLARNLKLDHWVHASVADGNGGWYIAGTFNSVDGAARMGVAHILSDNTLDPNFNIVSYNGNMWAGSIIRSLALSGNTLYIGGLITGIAGQTRNRLAAVNATTGALLSFNPNLDGSVNTMVVSGNTLFVGGEFSLVGSTTRNKLAAFDITTGDLTSWNPNASNTVSAIAMLGTTNVIVGGSFNTVGGANRSGLAALNTTDGTATSWAPNVLGTVAALATSGTTIYIGGLFSQIGSTSRSNLAAMTTSSTTPTSWNPGADDMVYSLAVSGSVVYAGGDFATAGGQARARVAALNTGNNTATTWNPGASQRVVTLSPSGSAIFVGGPLTVVGGYTRNNLAAFDATTGAATTWNPNVNGEVNALQVVGTAMYIGGNFTTVGGTTRNRLASIVTSTGALNTWNPNANGRVNALLVNGTTVYVGGEFTTINGTARSLIAALTTSSNAPTAWNPGATGSTVNKLALNSTTLYAGGTFTAMGGQSRNNLAALSTTTNTNNATSWNPNVNGTVRGLVFSDNLVYAAGEFTQANGSTTRNRLAAFDASTGTATAWDPSANGTVHGLGIHNGVAYLGGEFTTIGSTSRRYLAAVQTSTGALTSWTSFISYYTIRAFAFSNTTVYIGGNFSYLSSSDRRSFFASLSISCPDKPTITAGGPTAFCSGGSVTLSAPAGFAYLWSNNATTQSITVSTAGSYTVRTIANSCTSEASNATTVSVNSAPTQPTINAGGSTSLCGGGSVTLTAPAGFSYLWSNNATTQSITVSTAGNYTVQTIANGCTSAVSAPTAVTVASLATPSITAGGPTTICSGGTVTLSAPAGFSYLWSNNATTQSITVSTAGDYTVRTIASGCTSAVSTPVSISVTTLATPTILADRASTICTNDSITLHAPFLRSAAFVSAYTVANGSGYVDGPLASARFERPTSLVQDKQGNIYVADAGNYRIRKITPAGDVTTFAGSGQGNTDGTGTGAAFGWISSMAIDGNDNLYIADEGNYRIRKITPAGVVTTLAGSVNGYADGTGTAARFGSQFKIAINKGGELFVADRNNRTVRKVTQAGVVSTFAGSTTWGKRDGVGTAAGFDELAAIAVDSNGVIYVGESWSGVTSSLRRITATGVTTTILTTGQATQDGVLPNASILRPEELAVDKKGNLYFASDYRVRVLTPSGLLTTLAGGTFGGNVNGTASVARFQRVYGLLPAADGFLYAADLTNSNIRKIELPFADSYSWSNGAATVSINVKGSGSYTVRTIASGCTSATSSAFSVTASLTPPPVPTISVNGSTSICSNSPVTLSAPSGYSYLWSHGYTGQTFYTSTAGTYTVRVISGGCTSNASQPVVVNVTQAPATPTITASGPTTLCPGGSVTLSAPTAEGFIWSNGASTQSINVTASGDYSVRVIASGCTSWASATVSVRVRPVEQSAIVASGPTAICSGGSVTLSVDNSTLPRTVSTFAGNGNYGFADGPAASAEFAYNKGVAVDNSGNVYVADGGNNRIRKITPAGVVSTFAGSGNAAFADGQGTAAAFNDPQDIAIDNAGNLYVADGNNHRIRKITPTGLVTTLAGSGSNGFGDGTGTAAHFNFPAGLGLDASGNIYVADQFNHRIRKVTPDGVVTTLAGTGSMGSADGTGAAEFSYPLDVAVAPTGEVYVADSYNANIRKIATNGAVTTALPSGTLYYPTSLVFEGNNLLVNDMYSDGFAVFANSIVRVNANGTVSSLAGFYNQGQYTDADNGDAASAAFIDAYGLAVDQDGNLYVAEAGANRVRKVSAATVSSYLWSNGATTKDITVSTAGSYTVRVVAQGCTSAVSAPTDVTIATPATPTITANGPTTFCTGGSVTLTAPAGFDYIWSNGETTQSITISTAGDYTVRTIASGCTSAVSAATTVVVNTPPATPTIAAGGPTTFCTGGSVTMTAPAGFSYLWSNNATTQSITVSTAGSYTVRTIASGCTSAVSAVTSVVVNTPPATPTITANGPTTFCSGGSVTLTAPAGFDYIWSNGETTQQITATETASYTVRIISNGCTSSFSSPVIVRQTNPIQPLVRAGSTTTFCAGGSVQLFAPVDAALGMVSTLAGSGTNGATDGIGTTALFGSPIGIDIDNAGNLYVADQGNHRIRKITPAGLVSTLAGGSAGYLDGTGTGARFSGPRGVAVDNDGNVYVADQNNHRIRKITPAGVVTTLAGSGTATFADGIGTTASFNTPFELDIDADGNLYVADQGNQRIRKVTPAGVVTTVAGTGTQGDVNGLANVATFRAPSDVAVDNAGNIYVADRDNHRIRKISSAGVVTNFAGFSAGYGDGIGTAASFTGPTGIAIDAQGFLYVAELGNRRIRKISPDALVSTVAGSGTSASVDGLGANASFQQPAGVVVNPQGVIYIGDASGRRIRQIIQTPADSYVWSNGATTQSITVTDAGTYTVRTIAAGCTSAASSGTTVTIATPATPTIAANGPTTFCTGGSVTLTAPAGFSYLWSNNATTQSITVSTAGDYTVRTIANGCTSAVSAATTVVVNTPPATPTIAANGPTTFCSGGSVTLTAPAGFSYLWSTNATTQIITVSTAGSYTVRTIASGCTSAVSAVTSVVVNTPPATPIITANGPTTFNAGGSVVLSAPAGFSYLWSTGETTRDITVTASGSFTVQTIASGCTSAVSAPTVVTVNAAIADLIVTTNQTASGTYNNVTVRNGATLTLTGGLVVNTSLMIESGATLQTNCNPVTGAGNFTLASVATLGICDNAGIAATGAVGAVQNTGSRSFNGDATYEYNGSTAQVTGPGLPATVNTLRINNTAGVTLSQQVAIANRLDVKAGFLNANNLAIRLLASPTLRAILTNVNNGTLINAANTTFENWINPNLAAAAGSFFMVGAPVSGNTVTAWGLNNPLAGNTFDRTTLTNTSIRVYDPLDNTAASQNGWTKLPSATTPLLPGKGYWVYFRRTPFLQGDATSKITGTPALGTFNFTLPYCTSNCPTGVPAPGINLIANPYAAPIDWEESNGWNTVDMGAYYQVYSEKLLQYSYYLRGVGGVNGATRIIPPGQGFMVVANNANGSLSVLPQAVTNALTVGTMPQIFRQAGNQLRLVASQGTLTDEMLLVNDASASRGKDSRDADKAVTAGVNLGYQSIDGLHAISSLPFAASDTLPLRVFGQVGMPIQLQISSASTLTGLDLWILDHSTGIRQPLVAGQALTLATDGGSVRYSLLINPGQTTGTRQLAATQLSVFPNPAVGQFEIYANGLELKRATLTDVLGRTILTQTLTGDRATLSCTDVLRGTYFVRVETSAGTAIHKIVLE